MADTLSALVFLATPALMLLLARHVGAARALGPIVLCYAAGLLVGVSGVMPDTADVIRKSVTEVLGEVKVSAVASA